MSSCPSAIPPPVPLPLDLRQPLTLCLTLTLEMRQNVVLIHHNVGKLEGVSLCFLSLRIIFSSVFYKWNHMYSFFFLSVSCYSAYWFWDVFVLFPVCCFILLSRIPLVWICHDLFLSSSIEGLLGCCQLGAITNEVAMNVGGQTFVWHMFSFLEDKYLRAEWLDHMLGLGIRLVFKLFSKVGCAISHFHQQWMGVPPPPRQHLE